MLRSMFAGVSGLRSHQTMMDVVGNNISNVNTAGYKSSRATFQEALTQVTRGATAPIAGQNGGVNPMQIGLGTRVASIDGVFTQGAMQDTGRATDVTISGEGFFVVRLPGQNQDYFTRAGAFSWDAPDATGMSRLVGPNGERVQAVGGGDITVDTGDYADITIGTDGVITGRNKTTGVLEPLGTIAVATFANPNGLLRVGNSLFAASANSGAADIGAPNADGRGSLQAGTLEMSNVDLAQEFTNLIMAQRGFQANARTITTSDEMLSELVNIKR